LDGQRYPVLKFDSQNQTEEELDGLKWTFTFFSVRLAYIMLALNKERGTTYIENIASWSDTRAEKEWLIRVSFGG
jgi:hypothetical protein